SLTLVDAYASPVGDQPLLSVAASALVLGDGARLDYHVLQRWGEGAWHVATHRASIGAHAQLRFFGATLGARVQKAYWEAIADAVPRLEIKANDVRCGHGATAGHIDNDQRFYLMSRGVDRDEADRVIIRGFMQDALDHCPHAGVREFVAACLEAEIAGSSTAGLAAGGEVEA